MPVTQQPTINRSNIGHVFFLHSSNSVKDTVLKLVSGSLNYAILSGGDAINEIEIPDFSIQNLSRSFAQVVADDLHLQLYPFQYDDPQGMMAVIPTAQLILSSSVGKNSFKGENLPLGIKQIVKNENAPIGRQETVLDHLECAVTRLVVGKQEILSYRFAAVPNICYKVSVDTSVPDYCRQFPSPEDAWKAFCHIIIPALSIVLVAEDDIRGKEPFVHQAVRGRYNSIMTRIKPGDHESIVRLLSDLAQYGQTGQNRARKAAIRRLKADLDQFKDWHNQADAEQKPWGDVLLEEIAKRSGQPSPLPPLPSSPPRPIPSSATLTPPPPYKASPPPPRASQSPRPSASPPPSTKGALVLPSAPKTEVLKSLPSSHRLSNSLELQSQRRFSPSPSQEPEGRPPPQRTPPQRQPSIPFNPLATTFIPSPTPNPTPAPNPPPTPSPLSPSTQQPPPSSSPRLLRPLDFDTYAHHLCALPRCPRLTLAHDDSSLCCPWCGPFSYVRYCGPQHLIEHVIDHYPECGRRPLPGPVRLASLPERQLRGLVGGDVGEGRGPMERLVEIGRALGREGVRWVWRWEE